MGNKEVIYSIVKDYFALEEESLKIFKERLYNPIIDDIYKSFGLDENYRKYWSLKDHKEDFDKGWERFKVAYPSFVKKYEVTYNDFKHNKVTVNKNKVRLLKALTEHYCYHKEERSKFRINECTDIMGEINNLDVLLSELKKYDRVTTYFQLYFKEVSNEWDHKKGPLKEKDVYKSYIEKNLRDELNKIGSLKLPNSDDLYLVISCNFEDWFFCSTGNGWGSCLSLDSSYSYWSGLPGLITDTNRAVMYITDGEKKKPLPSSILSTYEHSELKLDKMILRSWLLLDENNKINVIKFYPSSSIDVEKINKVIKTDMFIHSKEQYSKKSKNKFVPLYHSNGVSSYIYQDNTILSIAESSEPSDCPNIELVFRGRGLSHHLKEKNRVVSKDFIGEIDEGFIGLFRRERNIGNYLKDPNLDTFSCFHCDNDLEEGDCFFSPDGNVYCEICFDDNFSYCSMCEDSIAIDDTFSTGSGDYCETCFNDNFFICEDCDNIFRTEEMVEIDDSSGHIVCEDCAHTNYSVCSNCEVVLPNDEIIVCDGEIFCESCAKDKDLIRCEKCDKVFEVEGKETVCEDCAENNSRKEISKNVS